LSYLATKVQTTLCGTSFPPAVLLRVCTAIYAGDVACVKIFWHA